MKKSHVFCGFFFVAALAVHLFPLKQPKIGLKCHQCKHLVSWDPNTQNAHFDFSFVFCHSGDYHHHVVVLAVHLFPLKQPKIGLKIGHEEKGKTKRALSKSCPFSHAILLHFFHGFGSKRAPQGTCWR